MTADCPACGETSREVPEATIRSLVREDVVERLPQTEHFHFCRTSSCKVAYHLPTRDVVITTAELTVAVFQKSADPARLVCYCFGYSVEQVLADASAGGQAVLDDISERCRQGLDRCEQMNPQGSCCIGNVRTVFFER